MYAWNNWTPHIYVYININIHVPYFLKLPFYEHSIGGFVYRGTPRPYPKHQPDPGRWSGSPSRRCHQELWQSDGEIVGNWEIIGNGDIVGKIWGKSEKYIGSINRLVEGKTQTRFPANLPLNLREYDDHSWFMILFRTNFWTHTQWYTYTPPKYWILNGT